MNKKYLFILLLGLALIFLTILSNSILIKFLLERHISLVEKHNNLAYRVIAIEERLNETPEKVGLYYNLDDNETIYERDGEDFKEVYLNT